eukprot:scaffold2063_cov401-Prasinococcus_capsulatus_cf.AAC.3
MPAAHNAEGGTREELQRKGRSSTRAASSRGTARAPRPPSCCAAAASTRSTKACRETPAGRTCLRARDGGGGKDK